MARRDETEFKEHARRSSDAVTLIAVTLAYTLVTVWWTWPGIRRWDTTVAYATARGPMEILQHADFHLIAWTITWVSHALATQPWTLFDGNTFFPARLSVAYSESMLGYVPLFGPVYWTTGNPVLALNVMSALTYPLAAVGAYLLARRWLGRAAAALVGLFYTFTVARYLTPPHYQCLGIAGFPLIVLAIERWLERGRIRHAVLLVAAIVLQAMSSAYFLYAILILLIAWLPASLWQHRRELDRRRVLGLLLGGATAAGIVVALMWPYLVLRAQGLVPRYDESHISLGLIPFIARGNLETTLGARGAGPLAWLLAAAGVLLARGAAQRWARRGALLLLVIGCVAALGPRLAVGGGAPLWSPYVLLRDWVPGFATVRAPGRFAVVAQLGIALLAGIGAEQLLLRRTAARMRPLLTAGLALLALSLLELPELPLRPVPSGRRVPAAYAYLREHGDGRAVIEVPPPQNVAGRALRAYLSTAHWQPIVEGYAANGPQHVGYVSWLSRALPGDAGLQQLVDVVDVGWLLVHSDQLDEAGRARWDAPLPAGLEEVGRWRDQVLYRVTRRPLDDRRARLVNDRVTLEGTPIAPVRGDCAGTLELVGWLEQPTTTDAARIEVRVVNRSSRVWPAAGFLPGGLVALETTVLAPDGRRVRNSVRSRIDADLEPHRPQPVRYGLAPPLPSGPYVLRVRLVQPAHGVLDDCVPPLEIPFDVTGDDERPLVRLARELAAARARTSGTARAR